MLWRMVFSSEAYLEDRRKTSTCHPDCSKSWLLKYAHDNPLSGHLGRLKTLLRLVEVCYWPTIWSDVWKHCKECQVCQKYKPSMENLAGYMQSTPVVEPGHMLGIDLMGPFPKSQKQNEHLLVIVDYCSKWVELFPLLRWPKLHKLRASRLKKFSPDGELPCTWCLTEEHNSLLNSSL